MANKCRECERPIQWATITNGKYAGKKRPFDLEDNGSGSFGLKTNGNTNKFGYEEYDAVEYDDPIRGLEFHERLFTNHFNTCPNKKSGSYSGGSGKVYVTVEVAGKYYGGYLSPIRTETHDGYAADLKPQDGSGGVSTVPESPRVGVQSSFDDDL